MKLVTSKVIEKAPKSVKSAGVIKYQRSFNVVGMKYCSHKSFRISELQ